MEYMNKRRTSRVLALAIAVMLILGAMPITAGAVDINTDSALQPDALAANMTVYYG